MRSKIDNETDARKQLETNIVKDWIYVNNIVFHEFGQKSRKLN